MHKKFTENILTFRWPLALGLILITLWLGDAIFRLQIDPSTESLFNKSSPEYKEYKEFSEQFGSDYMIAVAMATPDLFTQESLDLLRRITDVFQKFPQVERVLSLANANDIKHKFMGIKVEPALGEYYAGERRPEELRQEILENELYRNNLISSDGKVANILVYLKTSGEDRASSGIFIKSMKEFLKANEKPGVAFFVAGAPIEQYDFIGYIRKDQLIFIPVITLLLVLTTWFIYRSFACMVLAMTIVFMTLTWTMGSMVLLGQDLNLVSSLLAPVIMIVAIVNSIHLMNLFFEIRMHHPSLNEAVALTMSELGAACFLTHFTTVLGFASLAISPVPAIRVFGYLSALGTCYSYAIETLVTPLLLLILPYRGHSERPNDHAFNKFIVNLLEQLQMRWKWLIVIATIAVMVLSIIGIRRLEVDTSLIKQMKSDTPLAIATHFIDENLTGVYVLGFILRRKDGAPLTDYQSLKRIETIKEFLEAQPEIVKVNDITTIIKKINQAREDSPEGYKIPEEELRLKAYFKGLAEAGDADLLKIVTPDFRQVRLEARMKAVGTEEGARMEERVLRYLDATIRDEFEYSLTGNIVLLGKMAKGLVQSQMNGFGFAFLSILFLISLMFRSLWMGILASVPNVLPILAAYGFMGFMHIELSTPTAMISSIVLGMVVDASIHFLHRFRMEFEQRHHYMQAMHHTFRNVGQSLIVSTVILCIGFASSVFASFRPTILLGVLTGLTIFLALIYTLVVLPVCIVIFKPFGPPRLFRQRR